MVSALKVYVTTTINIQSPKIYCSDHYESAGGPYILSFWLWVMIRAVYFSGPYIYRCGTVYFQGGEHIFWKFEGRLFSQTVYFPSNDRTFYSSFMSHMMQETENLRSWKKVLLGLNRVNRIIKEFDFKIKITVEFKRRYIFSQNYFKKIWKIPYISSHRYESLLIHVSL